MSTIPSEDEFEQALLGRVGEDLQRKLSAAAVAVCGLGGLGSNIAVSLVRAGVGRLILIDFDRVDITNLNRQQYKANQIGRFKTEALAENLAEIAPYADITTVTERLGEDNCRKYLEPAEIVCEAFDRAEAKSGLVNYVLSNMPEKYLVAASGMAGLGAANAIVTRRITDRFYLCGDGVSDSEREALFSARVMLCAAHQATAVLRIIAGEYGV